MPVGEGKLLDPSDPQQYLCSAPAVSQPGDFADSFILSNARHGARYPDPTGKLCPSASKPVPLVLGMPDEVGETGFAPLIPEDTEQIAQAIHDI